MMLPGSLNAMFAVRGLWLAIVGLVIAALLALLLVQTVRLEGFRLWPLKVDGWIERAEKAEARASGCEKRLSTSNASIATLQTALAQTAEAARERAAALDARRARAEAEADELARKAVGSQARVDALEQILRAARHSPSGCTAPPELLEQLEGL